MILTGTALTFKRNVYTQTGMFGFGLACTVDNTTGLYRFGVTGAQGAIEFTLLSGRISYQNQFVHAYRANEEFSVEAEFSSGRANVIRGGAPLIYGEPKATGMFDYFYFTRENVGMGADFDLQMSGSSVPSYYLTTQGYLTSTGQTAVTGWFVNQSPYPIRIFDSTIQSSADYSFGKLVGNVGAASSGAFAYTGDFSSIDLSQPILSTFATNFDTATILFTIIDATTLNRFIMLTAPSDLGFNSDNVLNRDVSWLNYSGGFAGADYPTDLVFRLRYATGLETFTGVWNMFTGVDSSSLKSLSFDTGLISGSGRFSANSSINWQVTYSGASGNAAQLVISGGLVSNPINSTLTFYA